MNPIFGVCDCVPTLVHIKVLMCLALCWQRMSIADPKEVEINRLKTEYAELKRESVEQKRKSETEIARLKRKNEALESELRDLRQRPSDWTPAANPRNDDLLAELNDMPGDELQSYATPSRKGNPHTGARVRCEKCGKEYARNVDDTLRRHVCR